jgi:hypothetical protein
MDLNAEDLAQLAASGIAPEEARRQARLLAAAPPAVRLARPCVVGDGVRRLSPAEADDYERRGARHLAETRAAKFVPASGAASRMFKDLLASLESPQGLPAGETAKVLESAERFAFFGDWSARLKAPGPAAFGRVLAQGRWREALALLLGPEGLDYARLPKAFLPFHRVGGRSRTALEEHWREAADLGLKRLHFTLSPEHERGYQALLASLRGPLDADGVRGVELDYSFQHPSTDTLAGDGAGGLFRDAQGRLVLRPGGHGSLLRNLQDLAEGADVALVKNIDNIAHPRLWPGQLRYKRILAGLLEEAVQASSLDRPVRVAGVVANTGEPGGGPFWVEGLPQPQIVESAQVDLKDALMSARFLSSTHFNPVDMACRLTDGRGRPFDLERFVDPSAVFLASKSHLGRPLRALERPGLWNGAMAHWRSVFVELPVETFNPVKTVADLLKPAHQELG